MSDLEARPLQRQLQLPLGARRLARLGIERLDRGGLRADHAVGTDIVPCSSSSSRGMRLVKTTWVPFSPFFTHAFMSRACLKVRSSAL